MTKEPIEPDGHAEAAARRIRELQQTFDDIRAFLMEQIKAAQDGLSTSPKAVMAKLSELHTAQLHLSKSEEAFHEKYTAADDADIVDHEQIRAEIGRRLDRIRRAGSAGAVSDSPEP